MRMGSSISLRFLVYSLCIIAVLSAKTLYIEDETYLRNLWSDFKAKYDRNHYHEDNARFEIFKQNLRVIDQRNSDALSRNSQAVHGITKFSDWSKEEFKTKAKGLKRVPRGKDSEYNRQPARHQVVQEYKAGTWTSGDAMSWIGLLTTPIKNQKQCGGCWAFSTTEQIESDSMRQYGTYYELGPEQIIQCASNGPAGCDGGWTSAATDYVVSSGGIGLEVDYPFGPSATGVTGACQPNKIDSKVSAYNSVSVAYNENVDWAAVNKTEEMMTEHVLNVGTLSISLDAENWNSYTGGILSKADCEAGCARPDIPQNNNCVDHAVQIVGVDTSETGGYWLVRNSWGDDWGENGYIKIAYGQNACFITDSPMYINTAIPI